MNPQMLPVIGYDDIDQWVSTYLQPHFPDKHISVIPHEWEPTGESAFVCKIDIGDDITIEQLCKKVVKEHSRGRYVHFYANDILTAAYTNGQLKETYLILYYEC